MAPKKPTPDPTVTDFGSTLMDDPANQAPAAAEPVTEPAPAPEPAPVAAQSVDPAPATQPEPAQTSEPESAAAPASEPQPTINQVGEIDPAALERIETVLIQTGAPRSGAQKMLARMTVEEKTLLAQSITETNGVLRIADSAKYFTAFQSYYDRTYKASVEESQPAA